jgi:DNA-binding LacI/PurR family transcriptional regulator
MAAPPKRSTQVPAEAKVSDSRIVPILTDRTDQTDRASRPDRHASSPIVSPSVHRPTLRDVARRAGVSPSLASDVLRANPRVRASEATRARIARAAADLQYRPNASARNLRRASTGIIGLLVRDLLSPFYTEVLAGVERAAANAGYSTLLADEGGAPDQSAGRVALLVERAIDGLIYGDYSVERYEAAVEGLHHLGRDVPVIAFGDLSYVGPSGAGARPAVVPDVSYDLRLAGRLAVEHLLGLGRRRVIYVTEQGTVDDSRYRTYVQLMREAGLASQPAIGVPAWPAGRMPPDYGPLAALLDAAPQTRPDAIFAHSDQVAFWAVAAVLRAGLRIPEDVAVVGVDGLAQSADWFPPLTTVSLDPPAVGVACVDHLAAALGGLPLLPTVIEPRLIARASTTGAL